MTIQEPEVRLHRLGMKVEGRAPQTGADKRAKGAKGQWALVGKRRQTVNGRSIGHQRDVCARRNRQPVFLLGKGSGPGAYCLYCLPVTDESRKRLRWRRDRGWGWGGGWGEKGHRHKSWSSLAFPYLTDLHLHLFLDISARNRIKYFAIMYK